MTSTARPAPHSPTATTATPSAPPLDQAARDALHEGRLLYPRCDCGHAWLPATPECPQCLHAGRWQWATASGHATVESWVVYHVAYHPSFKDRVPYNVAMVTLGEGPRLITNLLMPLDQIRIGMPVVLRCETVGDEVVARFAPAHAAPPRPDTDRV